MVRARRDRLAELEVRALGAKGVGESPNVGSPPAIVNAIIDALHETHGVDHIDMPCNPARVWAAMQGRAEPPQ